MNHKLYGVDELKSIMHADILISNEQAVVRTLLTDSRKLHDHSKGLFFALKARGDGHQFIREVFEAGVRNFVISDQGFKTEDYPDANFYRVELSLIHI